MTGLNIEIDIREAAAMARAWAQAPEIVREELYRATLEAELLLERETQENTPIGVGGGGGLKGSISSREPQILADTVIGEVGTPLDYAIPVEFGSRPHRPPVQPLADWAKAKLGVSDDEAEGVGWAIASKIAKEGTEGAFMFTNALDSARPQIEVIFAQARQRIVDRLVAPQ